MNGSATAVSSYHRTGSRADFVRWCGRLADAAGLSPGHLGDQFSAPDAAELNWATSVTFRTEHDLHRWLDGADRALRLSEAGAIGFQRLSADVILLEGSLPATGVGVFRHPVAQARTDEFIATQVALVGLSAAFSGFEGAALLGPDQSSDEWLSVLRFRTDHQLQDWLNSAERLDAMPRLRSQLTGDFSVITHSTPFGSILRVQDGMTKVTPNWKTAMLVLLVLYPTVMTLSRFLGPVLDNVGARPWLSMWLSQIVSVGVMTWFLMPVVTGWFRRWLDPVDGAGVRVGAIGAGVVFLAYLATLTLFATVHWLQFWDYID
jgi:uncharacterized protein